MAISMLCSLSKYFDSSELDNSNFMVVAYSLLNLSLDLVCTGEYHRALVILTYGSYVASADYDILSV
jgi:hypothetical protein